MLNIEMKKNLYLLITIIALILLSPVFAYENKETLIIFDQSASMYEPFGSSIRFKFAKLALLNILKNIDDTESVGFRTIGTNPQNLINAGQVTSNVLCRQSDLLNDIHSGNRQNILNSAKGIVPSGMSPIEYVLNTAITNDFTPSTDIKHIILITDGYENCDGDPCGFIQNMANLRKDILIDIVAIGVNRYDAEKLKCLTSATNGKFIAINNPADIKNNINFNNDVDIQQPDISGKSDFSSQIQPPIQKNTNPEILYKNYLLEFSE